MLDKYTAPAYAHSALLTIDVQCDFTEPGSIAQVPGTSERVPVMRCVLEAYREYGLPIVHMVRLYLADGTNEDLCRRASIESGSAMVVPGSAGSELVEPLGADPQIRLSPELLLAGKLQNLADREWAIYKPRWDAFHGTPLDKYLRDLGVTTVVVIGCNFPNCPRATLYGASMRDFRAVMIADAVSGVYERGLDELNAIGVRTPSAEEYLAGLARAFQTGLARKLLLHHA